MEGQGSQVEGLGSQVEGRGLHVEGLGSRVRKSWSRVKSKVSEYKGLYVFYCSKERSIFVDTCWLNTKAIVKRLSLATPGKNVIVM